MNNSYIVTVYVVIDDLLKGCGFEEDSRARVRADEYDLRLYRKRIETVYSQMEAMGMQRLHARTNHGFDLKAHASLLALAFTNIISD